MTSPRFARLAARVLAEKREEYASNPSNLRPPAPPVRAEAITAIEQAIRASARRRIATRWTYGAAAAAAVLAIGFAGWNARGSRLDPTATPAPLLSATSAPSEAVAAIAHPSGGGATLGDPAAAPMIEGQPLAAGSRVVARPGGRALLAFATGTELTIEDGGDLTIVEGGASKILALRAGVLNADVAKLGEGERLVVRTADAEVEAHGTSFRVAIAPSDPACGSGTTTRLSVYEGSVVLRHDGKEGRVDAGSEWPSSCGVSADHARRASARAVRKSGAPSAVNGGAVAGPSAGASPAPSPASTLAEQNDQFADALAAKRAGDRGRAIARFETFLTKYPSSPLCESAAAQRMKLLRDVDPVRANDAARAYLARWPSGFAKGDAAAILGEHP